jgi:ribokinase
MVAAKVAVLGHSEWVDFAVTRALPQPGEILHTNEFWEEAAGGGAVAAVQMAKLTGSAVFVTALARDDLGQETAEQLAGLGVTVHAAPRDGRQRRGFVYLTDDHERTITVLGERHVPHGVDDLDWDVLADCDAVYFTGGDVEALRHARRARWLVATPRALDTLKAAGVQVDVLVGSATDPGEAVPAGVLDPPARFVVRTRGAEGGEWAASEGRTGAWVAEPLPGEPVDSYGCGDAFAAGLTYGLAAHDDMDAALRLAARCGAHALCGRGPYEGQLTASAPGT